MSTITTTEAASILGVASTHAARRQLHRWDIRPVGRQPGRAGESLYDETEVRQAAASRPGRGKRTDLQRGKPMTITADHLRELHTAQFADGDARGNAAIAIDDDGEPTVVPPGTADRNGWRIIITSTELHEQCEGDLDDTLAEQIATSLNTQD